MNENERFETLKSMTQEQKAKSYDEALKRAKDAVNDGTISSNTIAYLQDIFPELKESEDEKIRKKIIYLVKKSHEQGGYALHEYEADEMLTWLKKQGEQKPVDKVELAWREDDEENFRDIIGAIHSVAYQTSEDEESRVDWLKSLKNRVQPKQEWSEEDVAYIDELTDFFEHCGELHQPQEKVVKWLKSLKQRIGE